MGKIDHPSLWEPLWQPGRLWSLWQMYELKGPAFVKATRDLANMRGIIEKANPDDIISPEGRKVLKDTANDVMPHLEALRASVTWIEVDRLIRNLDEPRELNFSYARDSLVQIE